MDHKISNIKVLMTHLENTEKSEQRQQVKNLVLLKKRPYVERLKLIQRCMTSHCERVFKEGERETLNRHLCVVKLGYLIS